METVKFVCEFFFCNFWHWLGLLIYLAVMFRYGLITFNIGNSNKIAKDKEG